MTTQPRAARRGATAIEYVLIAAVIAFAIFAGLSQVGDNLGDMLGVAAEGVEDATAVL